MPVKKEKLNPKGRVSLIISALVIYCVIVSCFALLLTYSKDSSALESNPVATFAAPCIPTESFYERSQSNAWVIKEFGKGNIARSDGKTMHPDYFITEAEDGTFLWVSDKTLTCMLMMFSNKKSS